MSFKAPALVRLRQQPQKVLRALDVPLRDAVRRTLDLSTFLVPRRPQDERDGATERPLADTGFISGPAYNMQRLSVTWTAGYEHSAAGPIHEGFHWGDQIIRPPPHFLKKSFRRTRAGARRDVARVLADYLSKQFPSH
ncbi:hypothetical protein JJE73_35235 [Comamonas sp. JC664]|nr:hypothetical protein [Comamonas sp. JC664]